MVMPMMQIRSMKVSMLEPVVPVPVGVTPIDEWRISDGAMVMVVVRVDMAVDMFSWHMNMRMDMLLGKHQPCPNQHDRNG